MKVNRNEIIQFNNMIDACHLDETVSDEFKLFQKKRKKAMYKNILIRLGKYTFINGIAVSIFFWMKKVSVFIGSKLLITTIIVTVSTSSAILFKMIEKPITVPVQNIHDNTLKIDAPTPAKAVKPKIELYTLGLQSFKTESVDADTVGKVNLYMLQSLKNARNDGYAVFLDETGEKKTAYIVNQSIEKLSNIYYIQIKIIDKNTSAIILAVKGTAESENKLKILCDDLAQQVVFAVK
jgi:hypothetical protein